MHKHLLYNKHIYLLLLIWSFFSFALVKLAMVYFYQSFYYGILVVGIVFLFFYLNIKFTLKKTISIRLLAIYLFVFLIINFVLFYLYNSFVLIQAQQIGVRIYIRMLMFSFLPGFLLSLIAHFLIKKFWFHESV